MKKVARSVGALLCFVIGLGVCSAGSAQDKYPSRPIRMLQPFAAGGNTDTHGRMLAARMQPMLGQSIIVEARPGGSGVIATAEVIRAKPDGYTLLLGTSSNLIIAPNAAKKPPYDVLKDLATIAIIGVQPTMIVVHPDMPAKSLTELIALLKTNPGKYNYGVAAGLSVNSLMMEMFKKQAGDLKAVSISYKGANEVIADLMAGRVQFAALTATGATGLHRSGKGRVLATCSDERLKSVPDIPTAIESGLPNLVVSTFNAISVPAATPKPITERLGQVLGKITASPDYIRDLDKLGMETLSGSSPERAAQFVREVAARWTPEIRALAAAQQ